MKRELGTAWYHEDDYCQVELLPRASEAFARRQAAEIDAFSAAHWDGTAWTDMYMRPDAPVGLATLQISVPALAECVPPPLLPFRCVTTGYSSHSEPAPRTVAWGLEGKVPLALADHDDDNVVQHVWLTYFGGDIESQPVCAFVLACGQLWPLVLADWAKSHVVNVSEEAAVRDYFEHQGE